jgi:hypothetical protein
VSFDSRECWDCPSPIFPVILWLAAGLALLLIALFLVQERSRLRLVGYCLIPVVALWYLVVSGLIWKFGIVWITGAWYPPRNPMADTDRRGYRLGPR